MIRSIETREIRNERTILSIVVTDFEQHCNENVFAKVNSFQIFMNSLKSNFQIKA